MLEWELLSCLFVVNPSTAKGREPISQETYFNNSVEVLSSYPCSTCGSHNLFKGFFFIQCRECSNLFLDESELTELMMKQYSKSFT